MSTAQRLIVARQAIGMDIASVANEAGIEANQLVGIEAGQQDPEPEVLWDLAQVLDIDVGFLLRDEEVLAINPLSEGIAALHPDMQTMVIAQTQIWMEHYLDVESFFPVEALPTIDIPDGFPRPGNSARAAAEAGEALRIAWGLGDYPIANLAVMLENHGFRVGLIGGVEGFQAAAVLADEQLQIPAIAANASIPGQDQRFAIARELAYFLLEGATHQTAPHFAGAFLAPAGAMRTALGTGRTSVELYELDLLKHDYGIGLRHLLARAASLRIMSRETMTGLVATMRENGWDTTEPGVPVTPDHPTRMLHLVLRLQGEGEIEADEAAELLDLQEEDWNILLQFQLEEMLEA
jgi:transcriptional regulator with XRE-family HTH domain/Zn-dependent peptidase ImmA (M78 family)